MVENKIVREVEAMFAETSRTLRELRNKKTVHRDVLDFILTNQMNILLLIQKVAEKQ